MRPPFALTPPLPNFQRRKSETAPPVFAFRAVVIFDPLPLERADYEAPEPAKIDRPQRRRLSNRTSLLSFSIYNSDSYIDIECPAVKFVRGNSRSFQDRFPGQGRGIDPDSIFSGSRSNEGRARR